MAWLFARTLALKHWLLSLQTRLKTRRTIRRASSVSVLSLLLLLLARPTHAQSTLSVDSILEVMADFAFSIASTITKGIVLIIDVLIPVMTYNDFTNNPVVSAGWAIVRDTVNMFFVVVLIIIAVGTIFGHKRFQWQQQVPQLLIWAVVINFSKMLCGIMIDFGQVVMLTFANALREIAAGNFIQLLGLNQLYSASSTSTFTSQGGSSFDFFAGGIMAVLLTVWVFGTMIILAAILIYRIVMLWVLVVIAPLAWFMKGAEGVINSNAYAEWWSEFKCLVGVGPILVFFLWLTLSVAGAGNLAALSNFDVSSGSNNADFILTIFELDNMMSFLIGMAMLFAGFKAATNFCGGTSGKVIGGLVGKAQSGSLQRTALGLTARVGSGAGRLGLRAARATGRGVAGTSRRIGFSDAAGRAAAGVSDSVRGAPSRVMEGIGRATGITGLEQAGIAGQARIATERRQKELETMDRASEKMKDYDSGTKAKLAEALLRTTEGKKDGATSAEYQAQGLAMLEMMMGDKGMQKALGNDRMKQMWSQYGDRYMELNGANAEKMSAVDGFKRSNSFALKRDENGNVDRAEVERLIDNYDDAKGLSEEVLRSDAGAVIRQRLGNIDSGFRDDEGNNINALDALAQRGSKDQRAAVAAGVNADSSARGAKDIGERIAEEFERALASNNEHSQSDQEQALARFGRAYNGASPEDRAKMEKSMQRMKQSMENRGGGSAATQTAFASMTGRMDRIGYSGFPPVTEDYATDEYLDAEFEHSTKRRKQEAVYGYGRGAKQAEAKAKRLGASMNGKNATVANELKTRRAAHAQKRQQVVAEAYAQVDRMKAELAAKEQARIATSTSNASTEQDVQDAIAAVNAQKRALRQAETAAKRAVENNDDLKDLEASMNALIESADNMDADSIAAMKDENAQIMKLDRQADRLKNAQSRLSERLNNS